MRRLVLVLVGALALAAAGFFVLSKNTGKVEWVKDMKFWRSTVQNKQTGSDGKEENILPAKQAAPREDERPPSPPMKVSLPEPLQRLRFGMAAADVAGQFPPGWRKDTRKTLTLVHYPDESRTRQYRFEFSGEGLSAVEVRVKPGKPGKLAALYHSMHSDASRRFRALPASARTRWTDGHVTARILKGRNYVALRFTKHK